MDFWGFDSVRFLISRGGVPRSLKEISQKFRLWDREFCEPGLFNMFLRKSSGTFADNRGDVLNICLCHCYYSLLFFSFLNEITVKLIIIVYVLFCNTCVYIYIYISFEWRYACLRLSILLLYVYIYIYIYVYIRCLVVCLRAPGRQKLRVTMDTISLSLSIHIYIYR